MSNESRKVLGGVGGTNVKCTSRETAGVLLPMPSFAIKPRTVFCVHSLLEYQQQLFDLSEARSLAASELQISNSSWICQMLGFDQRYPFHSLLI